MSQQSSSELNQNEELAIQREILECSRRVYDFESEFRGGIDKKAQIFLSLLTFLLGSVLLSGTFWGLVAKFRSAAVGVPLMLIFYLMVFSLLILIPWSFICLLKAVSPRAWPPPLPRGFYAHLFDPGSPQRANQISVIKYAAQGYAMAAEDFWKGTGEKSRNLVLGARLAGAVFVLFFVLATIMAIS